MTRTLYDILDGPLAGERRWVDGLWGTHVFFNDRGVYQHVYQIHNDGHRLTFVETLGEES